MTPNVEILKVNFREFCVNYLVLREIDDIFSTAGFSKGELDNSFSGQRRTLIENYYASLNWENIETVYSPSQNGEIQ